jgi:acyl-CoA synthetase (AMP-forming)/AMP-acid ligase II
VVAHTAGYHARRTAWRWAAGVGRTADGRVAGWNLVSGVNDPPRDSERTVWIDGAPREAGPCTFAADLSGVRTGDGGDLDEDGYLFLTDRIKDMIVTGGENVYPIEVESILAEHPSVAEVAVVGVPDKRWGESVTAVVKLVDGADVPSVDELIAFSTAKLASYKKPRQIHFVDSLPRNASGKLLKSSLRTMLNASGEAS